MGPGSGLALDGGGARAVVLTLGSVLNVKPLLLKSVLLFLLNPLPPLFPSEGNRIVREPARAL